MTNEEISNERWANVEEVDYSKPYAIMCKECGNMLDTKDVVEWADSMPILSNCIACDEHVRTKERNYINI